MNSRYLTRCGLAAGIAVLLAGLAGCGPKAEPPPGPGQPGGPTVPPPGQGNAPTVIPPKPK